MSDKIVQLSSRQDQHREKKKEQKFKAIQQQFENALPVDETDPKQKLLNIFKKKK